MTGTNKHLTYDDRLQLLSFVSKNYSMRKIGTILGKSPSSISRELKINRYRKRVFNDNDTLCTHARTCSSIKRGCSQTCKLYRLEPCPRLLKAPWICL
ncbi:MAG: helix-turn-helix domain-containing protein, partial [Anaerorhabdus sp.]